MVGEGIYDNKFYYFLLKILFPSLLQVAHNICKQWRHFLSFEEKLSSNTKSTTENKASCYSVLIAEQRS